MMFEKDAFDRFKIETLGRTPDLSGKKPFLKRLSAVLCAFQCVASIMRQSSTYPAVARLANILLNTPIRLRRAKRLNNTLGFTEV